jgi:hypothetical protein
MQKLICTDLHLTARPQDEYRWGIFPWLRKRATDSRAEAAFILGDLTEEKDKHPASLVNRLTREVRKLAKILEVFILKGNHDYKDPRHPFFGFLSYIPNVHFISKPAVIKNCLFLPHTRTPERDWVDLAPQSYEAVFVHQTFSGARAENGTKLDGLPVSMFKRFRCPIYSGDLHVPQEVGPVTYVGAPYHVRFGDGFTPRCLLVSGKKERDLHFKTLRKFKLTVRGPKRILKSKLIHEGDQVKIVIRLRREDMVLWQEKKAAVLKACQKRGLDVHDVDIEIMSGHTPNEDTLPDHEGQTATESFQEFCQAEKVDKFTATVGLGLMRAK